MSKTNLKIEYILKASNNIEFDNIDTYISRKIFEHYNKIPTYTLENILEALGTNLKDFFSEDEDEQIVFSKDDFFENIQDDYKISYIIPNAQKNEMEPILIELKKGKNSMEIDPHDGEEFGYVIHGKITLMNGDEEYEVKKGETFYLKGNLPHYIVNKHDTLAKVIWVSTPPIF